MAPEAAPGDPAAAPEPRTASDRSGPEDDRHHLETSAPAAEPVEARERDARPSDAEAAGETESGLPGRPVETRYGGVLYLIHALVALRLPDAFERGWRLASDAGPWGTLDLVARGLLGGGFERAADDPLWSALAGLADWPEEAPRRRGRPAYRVPRGWPAELGDPLDATSWSSARGRLRLWSDRGYLLADVLRTAGPSAPPSRQARRELARVAPGAQRDRPRRRPAASAPLATPPPLPAGCPPRLGDWLAAALPAIRRRLLLALAVDRELDRVLAVPGRLHVTSSHVDLVLPMAAADLAVRRAGLDRDPGWLPAFGRVVAFHFE